MKLTRYIAAISLGGALAAGAALAGSPTNIGKLPDEVTTASIRVNEGTAEDQATLQRLARLTRPQAQAAALAALPGQVVKAQLENEDGFLVWQVDVRSGAGTTEIAVDAGNGKVLAAEAEEDDDRGGADREDNS